MPLDGPRLGIITLKGSAMVIEFLRSAVIVLMGLTVTVAEVVVV